MKILICSNSNDGVPLYLNVEHIVSFHEVAGSTTFGTQPHTAIYMTNGSVEKVRDSAAEIISALQKL